MSMSMEQGEFRPVVIAERASLVNLLGAVLDSPILRMRIRFGRLNEEGKTVKTKKGIFHVDQTHAKSGDMVVIHEI